MLEGEEEVRISAGPRHHPDAHEAPREPLAANQRRPQEAHGAKQQVQADVEHLEAAAARVPDAEDRSSGEGDRAEQPSGPQPADDDPHAARDVSKQEHVAGLVRGRGAAGDRGYFPPTVGASTRELE